MLNENEVWADICAVMKHKYKKIGYNERVWDNKVVANGRTIEDPRNVLTRLAKGEWVTLLSFCCACQYYELRIVTTDKFGVDDVYYGTIFADCDPSAYGYIYTIRFIIESKLFNTNSSEVRKKFYCEWEKHYSDGNLAKFAPIARYLFGNDEARMSTVMKIFCLLDLKLGVE